MKQTQKICGRLILFYYFVRDGHLHFSCSKCLKIGEYIYRQLVLVSTLPGVCNLSHDVSLDS